MDIDLTNPIFHDEAKATAHMEADRWPDGAVCPHCGSTNTHKGDATSKKYFFQDLGLFCWGILADQFKEQGITSVQGVTPEAFDEAMTYLFGDEQPVTNQVVEVKIYTYITKPKDGSVGRKMGKADWKGIVPVEILREHLSEAAKAQFPAGYFA